MPVLLAPDRAPVLPQLLQRADSVGLGCKITNAPGADTLRIAGLGSLTAAGGSEISFLSNPRLADQLRGCRAGAVILRPEDWQAFQAQHPGPVDWAVVLCAQPYLLYALLAQWFDQHRLANLPQGIHPSAVVAADATLEAGVHVGPLAIIESGCRIGAGTRIGAGCVIGPDCDIGRDSLLHAHVTLYHGVRVGARAILHAGVVLGADGFGFAPDPRTPGAWAKIAQLGGVRLGDDVEIGANTTVDRGAIEDTVLGNGVKLDNQIMIGHNCQIGDHTAMAACVGVAGSTTMGKRCVIGGAAMFGGHLTLADDVHISGGTAVTSDILKPGRYTGVFPVAEHTAWQHNAAVIGQLAQLRKRVRSAERAAASGQPTHNKQDTR
ncbi:UDP-3-O-(3-hydroxymyristoyl)glucosamine N-acyltransferase [Castellaniella caeni]|uniref:UDP-3-O-(3-hydroxymyristoyl)glucosamine N-acyltransferase n=1 Tax=Castellaniella caeni TaxID=266123 RepID=UPI0008373B0F|nr:UDP-3-O-(3-hydroxymyristoyl)glucosamine N-acyltransferase [Castellaniella caeni]